MGKAYILEINHRRPQYVHGGKKCGNWEAPSQEMLVFGGKFWNLVGNFVFLYIKTHNKLWENWSASREIKIFSSPEYVYILGVYFVNSEIIIYWR